MPRISNMPTAPAPTTAARQTEEREQPTVEIARPVIYPEVCAEVRCGANAITERDAEIILDWLTERQYQARMMRRQPGTEAAHWQYGDVYMLKDAEANKVRCLNNLDNRPFDEKWCAGLTQTILKFQWAGSITITDLVEYVYGKQGMEPWAAPDGTTYNVGDMVRLSAGTINGSSIGLSRTGRVESGQHSLCGLKMACQKYRAAPRGTYPEWDSYLDAHASEHDFGPNGPAPVLETILAFGLSEDRRVLMTVDNCKPRTEADVFYTSDIFVKLRDYPSKRREMSRMLAAAVDLFWKRTARQGYKTHSEVMQLVVDHPRLIKCVEHLFQLNAEVLKDRASGRVIGGHLISNLGLSAGQCACLLYLMGVYDNDGDEYRNSKPAPREKGLDWEYWDAAKEFWCKLVSVEPKASSLSLYVNSPDFEPVRHALLTKVIGDTELTGSLSQRSKLHLLRSAWDVWRDEQRQFTELDLQEDGCLYLHFSPARCETVQMPDGTSRTVDTPAMLLEDPVDFGGIDVPDVSDVEGVTQPMSEEEMTAECERIRQERAHEAEQQVQRSREGQDAVPVSPRPRLS